MSLRHALLGFLAIKPMTGYDLQKHFNESAQHFWPADQAQIYRTLSQLVDEKLVKVKVIPQDGKPDRKEHSILAAGRKELDQWLLSPLESESTREPFLLRVFFAERLGKQGVLELLEQRELQATEMLKGLKELEANIAEQLKGSKINLGLHLQLSTLSNGISHVEAEMKWLRQLRREVESK